MTPRLATLILAVAGGLSAVATAATRPSTAPIDDLPPDPRVRAAVLANEQTRARLTSFACEITGVHTDRGIGRDTFGGVRKYKHAWQSVDWKPPRGPRMMRCRAVLNSAYYATWRADTAVAYQYEYDAPAPSEDIVNRMEIEFAHDPLLYAFGSGRQTLRQMLSIHRHTNRYSVEDATDASGRPVLRLSVFTPMTAPKQPTYVYDLDPACGHAVVRFAMYGNSGEGPAFENVVDLQPAGPPDTWVPRRVVESAEMRSRAPRTILMDVRVLTAKPLPDTDFRLAALALPQSTTLIRTPPSGRTEMLTRVNGVWLPTRLTLPLARAATTASQPTAPAAPASRLAQPAVAIPVAAALLLLLAALARRHRPARASVPPVPPP
jgi:hypothetical protein